ncbi:hypothetical protein PspLS_03918 [Pyricularia sp. CBS 133598]|nr:hypothetical protein PspLS_03918 [Pyricularia sp. CBS 133598]
MADETPTTAEYFPEELEPRAILNVGPISHQPTERFTPASESRVLSTGSDYSLDEPLETDISSGESTYLGSPAGSIHPSKGKIEERVAEIGPETTIFSDTSQINGAPSSNRLDSVVHYPVILPSGSETTLVDGSWPRSQDCSASTSSGDSKEALLIRNAQRLARDSIRHPLDLADSRHQPPLPPNGENHMNGGTKDNKSNPTGTDQYPSRELPFVSSSAPSNSLTIKEDSRETALRRPSTGSCQTSVKQDHPELAQDDTFELSDGGDEIWTRQVPDSQRINGFATRTVVFKTRAGNPVRIVNQPKQPFVSCRGLRVVNPDATPNGGADYESSDDLPRKPSFIPSGSGTLKLSGDEKYVESEESLVKIYSSLSGNPKRVSLPIRLDSASTSSIYKPTNLEFASNGIDSDSKFSKQAISSLVVDTSSDFDESSSNDSLSTFDIAATPPASQANPEEKQRQQNLGIKTKILGDQIAGTLDQLKTARWSLGLLWRTFLELLRMTFSLTFRIIASTARGVGAIFQFDLRAFTSLLEIWLQFGQVVIHTFLASTVIVTIAVVLSLIRTRFFAVCKEAFYLAIQAWDGAVHKFLSLRSSLSAWLSIPANIPPLPQQDFQGVPTVEHSHHWTRSEPEPNHRGPNIQSSLGKPKSQRVSFQDTSLKPTYLRVTTQPDTPSATQRPYYNSDTPRNHTGEKADTPREALRARGVKPTGQTAGWMRTSQGIGSKSANY